MTRRVTNSFAVRPLFRQLSAYLCTLAACGGLSGQTLLNGPAARPIFRGGTDLAVLESAPSPPQPAVPPSTPKTLPRLDLRFHSGFDITRPAQGIWPARKTP